MSTVIIPKQMRGVVIIPKEIRGVVTIPENYPGTVIIPEKQRNNPRKLSRYSNNPRKAFSCFYSIKIIKIPHEKQQTATLETLSFVERPDDST
jgi:hypothetical protein